MVSLFGGSIWDEQGQDLVEYAFLILFVALAVMAGLESIAGGVNNEMSTINSKVSGGS